MSEHVDIAIVGAGAAGLMAATWAGRSTTRPLRIVALDGAAKLGAKILVAGGGRCNVTHDAVDERAFAGSTPAAIRRVLRRFGVDRTIAFFAELGVALKREETGKLFPVTDAARTVLDALVRTARESGAELRHPCRVESIAASPGGGFDVRGPWGGLAAARVVLATGGMSLPKSGSDGHGYRLARALGHRTTARIFPALVPLLLADDCALRALAGVAAPCRLTVRASGGKRLASIDGPVLLTHFGVSGPAVLDVSRFLLDALADDPGARLVADWLPGTPPEQVDADLRALGPASPGRWLRARLPERLALALCREAGVDPATPGHALGRDARRALVRAVSGMELPVTGHRGFAHAEVTAGGVPLAEVHLDSLASRRTPGLFLCGEILDVDGRIGGYNFQWAWASGFVAGTAAVRSLDGDVAAPEV